LDGAWELRTAWPGPPNCVRGNAQDGRYRGSTTLKQTDFGIALVNVAGGTVKVKDEVKSNSTLRL